MAIEGEIGIGGSSGLGALARVAACIVAATVIGLPSQAATTDIVGSTTAKFGWAPASGPVAGYFVYVARNGVAGPGEIVAATAPDQLQVVVAGNFGESLVVQVAAYASNGTIGPLSSPSDVINLVAPTGSAQDDVDGALVFVTAEQTDGVQIQAYRMDGSLGGVIDLAFAPEEDPTPFTVIRPARCDLDGDGTKEIVLGFGPGSGSVLEVFTNEVDGFRPVATLHGSGGPYVTAFGETRPACGDLDGDGRDEIVVGRGEGGSGVLDVFEDELADFAWQGTISVGWPRYASSNGSTWPAVGDVDADGMAEIVVGLGRFSEGWIRVFDDATKNYAYVQTRAGLGWLQVDWTEPVYAEGGATYPATGDIDGDGADEIIVGLGRGSQGTLYVFDDGRRLSLLVGPFDPFPVAAGTALLVSGWASYNQADGSTLPTAADIDGDGFDELMIGFGADGQGKVHQFDPVPLTGGGADLLAGERWLQRKAWALSLEGVALAR